MTVNFLRTSSAALIWIIAAQAAHADLTAQDVWADWKGYLNSAGYEVTAEEQTAGGNLTISNMLLSMPMPENEGNFTVELGSLTLRENGDGTVSVDMPTSIPLRFEGAFEGEETVSGVITYTQSGNSMIASGVPNDLLYNYSAAEAGIALTSLVVEGELMPDSLARISVVMSNVSSSTQMVLADQRSYAQRMNADTVSYDFAFDDPESDDRGEMAGNLQGVGFQGTGTMPLEMDPSNFQAMLDAGFRVDGVFTYASGNGNISGVGDGENFSATSSSQGGKIAVTMDASQIAYDVDQKATALSFSSPELPFPVEMNAAISAINLKIPVAKSDEEQDFSFGIELGDFTMSDMLWGMFDPAAQLPRDPATIALDMTGRAKVFHNFLDPQVAASLEESEIQPGELNALTIKKLLISIVGARLSGTGDFTFDNSDLTSFDGMPKPTGFVDLELVGANGLLDKLIAMGIVGDEEAMGARMMMGMLAVPGNQPDTLNSKIEINAQGHVLANGQRIQ